MLGAIAGDIIGSVFEFHPHRDEDFQLFSNRSFFTDDSVLTFATADVLLHGRDYARGYKEFGRRYPGRGYGGKFYRWLISEDLGPYNSFGNGSAMRVAPVGWAFNCKEDVLAEAQRSAAVTHDHPEGIKGAQAVALSIFMARNKASQDEIGREITALFGYDLSVPVKEIRTFYGFDETCQGSVPQSITAFLESHSYEDAVRKAVSMGGDADTMACIAGAIAEAYFGGVPETIRMETIKRLPDELITLWIEFERRYLSQL